MILSVIPVWYARIEESKSCRQLRMDFFGTTTELKGAAKGFVRAVNENTVAYLEEVVAKVRTGEVGDDFAAELTRRVAEDDQRLHSLGQRILARIRVLPEARARTSRGRAVAVASVAIALAGCPPRDTAPIEAAPPPPPTTTGEPPPTKSSTPGRLTPDPCPPKSWRRHRHRRRLPMRAKRPRHHHRRRRFSPPQRIDLRSILNQIPIPFVKLHHHHLGRNSTKENENNAGGGSSFSRPGSGWQRLLEQGTAAHLPVKRSSTGAAFHLCAVSRSSVGEPRDGFRNVDSGRLNGG